MAADQPLGADRPARANPPLGARRPPVLEPGSRVRVGLAKALLYGWIACFAGGVFLGLGLNGRPLVPGATVLLAPAGGALAIVTAFLFPKRLTNPHWQDPLGLRMPLLLLVFSVALLGCGVLAVSNAQIWRLLCLPGVLWVIAAVVDMLRHRPSSIPTLIRARKHGGPFWMWQAYLGLWLILLVCPVGVAWSVGLIHIS